MTYKKRCGNILSHTFSGLSHGLSVGKATAPTPRHYHSRRDRYHPRCGAIVIIFTENKFARFAEENDSITPHYVCSCLQEHYKYKEKKDDLLYLSLRIMN